MDYKDEIEKVEGEIIDSIYLDKKHVQVPAGTTKSAKLKAHRDPMGQREATYKRYKQGVDYSKLGSEDLSEIVGTIRFERERNRIQTVPTFASGDELEGAIDAYWSFLADCAEDGRTVIPDVEGMCAFLGISRRTFMAWGEGKTNAEFVPIVENALNQIAATTKQLMFKNKIPTLAGVVSLNNNHGYSSQRQEVKVDVTAHREAMSREQLIENARLLRDDQG